MIDITKINVKELIPQKEPFVMLDNLLFANSYSAESSWKIPSNAIFVNSGKLSPCAFLENMAQTCAVQLGYIDKYIFNNIIVRIGFIGSVKNFTILEIPSVGDTIITKIEILEQIMDMKLINAVSKIDDRVVATAELKIAISDKSL